MLGQWGQWGQWTMGPPETLTLHKHGQIISDLADTPPYSTARFTFILNILVPSSHNYEKQCFPYFWWLVFSHGSAGNQPNLGP